MISPNSWGLPPRRSAAGSREQLFYQAEHFSRLRATIDVATDPKPSPDLAVALALPGRSTASRESASTSASIATSSAKSDYFRGLRHQPLRAAARACSSGGRRKRPCPRWRRDSIRRCRAVPGEAAVRRAHRRDLPIVGPNPASPSWPPANPPAMELSVRFSGGRGSSAAPDRPCVAGAGNHPAPFRFYKRHWLEPEFRYAQLAVLDRSCTARMERRSARCAPSSISWPSPSGPAGSSGMGPWTSRVARHMRPRNGNFLLKIIGQFHVRLGHFD